MKQYAASPIIQTIISDRESYFVTGWQDQFYDLIWNMDTNKGIGLDIWGRIVVIGRNVQISTVDTTFGFYEAWSGESPGQETDGELVVNNMAFILSKSDPVRMDNHIQPFDQAPFYDGLAATETYRLPDEAYRKLIFAKALANISDCSVPSLNKVLRYLFGSDTQRCYAQSSNRMDIRYVFEFELSEVDKTIAALSGVIPRPAGVKVTILQLDPETTFGFAEGEMQPFDQGVFLGNGGVINAK